MSTESYMCVSFAGGQGKTTMSQVLYTLLKRQGKDISLVSADFVDHTGKSKLGKFFPDLTMEFGIGADLTEARKTNNPNAALRYWDKFGYVLMKGGAIIDIGANVFPSMLTWAKDRHIYKLMEEKQSPPINLLVVTKAESHSVENAKMLIRSVVGQRLFRFKRIVIVRNEASGSFEGIKFDDLNALPGANISFLDIPRCYSEIWETLEKRMVPLMTVLDKEEDKLLSLLDVDLFTAASGKFQIQEWLNEVERRIMAKEIFAKNAAEVETIM